MLHANITRESAARVSIRVVRDQLAARWRWLAIVIAPTLVVAAYFGLIAADQYESEAHFLVRSASASPPSSTGLSQALTMISGATSSPNDAASISDYLSSHDAVGALRQQIDIVDMFRRPGVDPLSKLYPANPTPERLLRYYRDMVDVKQNAETSITTLRVRTFRANDSLILINALLQLGEQRVNVLNQRVYESTLRGARKQLAEAETAVTQAQSTLTHYRQNRQNIDPVATGQAQIGVVASLQTSLAQARAQRAALGSSVGASSPQAVALASRVRALETQVAVESSRLTGSDNTIAAKVGGYQELQLRQQFAAKRYEEAAASMQRAREQAIRQQLFVVRVVDPNLPGKALYPKGFKVVATVFVTLALAYAIGWLIIAGVREHAA